MNSTGHGAARHENATSVAGFARLDKSVATGAARRGETLRPFELRRRQTDTELSERTVENVGSMAGGIHPRIDDGRRRALTKGNIFRRRGVLIAVVLKSLKGRQTFEVCVREIVFRQHVFAVLS